MWVSGYQGISCNIKADELARQASRKELIGPAPSLLLPKSICKTKIYKEMDLLETLTLNYGLYYVVKPI